MTRNGFLKAALAGLALTFPGGQPAIAVPGGEIKTLPTGWFRCEVPGDITQRTRLRVPDEDFKVVSASSYVVDSHRGTYLLTGERLVMTSGPFEGKRYHRTSYGLLRRVLEDGSDGPMRCVQVY